MTKTFNINFDTNLSRFFRISSLLITFGFFVLKVSAFLVAWSSPYKAVVVAINAFGEGNTEAVLVFILLPIVAIGLVQNLLIMYRLDMKKGIADAV